MLAALFNGLNGYYFAGTLPSVPVTRGLVGNHRLALDVLAQCETGALGADESGIEEPGITIAIHIAEALYDDSSGWPEISRCLLHEMVHVAVGLDEIGGRYVNPIDGHGREFANECNRIGRAVGWSEVVASEETSDELYDAMWWPRPEEYFHNMDLTR